jgi:hypothetical protein
MDRKGTTQMKRSLAHLLATSLGLFVFAGTQAQAGFVGWDYSWSPNALVVPADSGGTGGVSLTFMALTHADGPSDVVATNIRTFSSAPRETPDTVTSGNYSLTMNLVDSASGEKGSVTFTGMFSGTFSTTSSNLANTFTGPTSQTLTLGGHVYTVTIGPYAPPGPPGAANAGTISAHVDVDMDSGGGTGGNTPEPSTLVLSGLGLSFLGVASWRKRRSQKARV